MRDIPSGVYGFLLGAGFESLLFWYLGRLDLLIYAVPGCAVGSIIAQVIINRQMERL